MWEWLAENPGKSKSKYLQHVKDDSLELYYFCNACKESGTTIGHYDELSHNNCIECPIDWPNDVEDGFQCEEKNSPYVKWFREGRKKKYALQMLDLIKSTWKE